MARAAAERTDGDGSPGGSEDSLEVEHRHVVVPVHPLDIPLDPRMRSDEAVRILARRQLRAILANHSGTRMDLDPEYLHDFRVAVRRSRSLVTQMKGVLPEGAVRHFAGELAWLGDATGPCRDLDVLLEAFGAYEEVVWEDLRGGAGVLRSELLERRIGVQRALAGALGSGRFEQFVRDWRGFLHSPLPLTSAQPNAVRPVRDVGAGRIRHNAKRIFSWRGMVDEDTTPKELHKLRVHFKKLRYLIEFFGELFAKQRVARAIAELKVVQDDLGALNDARVHRTTLTELSANLQVSGEARTEAVMAAGELTRHLSLVIDERRRAFAADFRRYTRPKNRRRYRKLLES
jgi:CHAD domain-containing protein